MSSTVILNSDRYILREEAIIELAAERAVTYCVSGIGQQFVAGDSQDVISATGLCQFLHFLT
jgi:ribose 5-phosphate isomerase RpiB